MFLILIIGLISSPFTFADLNEKPFLQELSIPKTLAENQTIRLLCAIVQGEFIDIDFQWFLNDQKLVPNSRLKIMNREDSSELTIRSLSIDDLGELKCTATNKYGQENNQKGLLNFNSKYLKMYLQLTLILFNFLFKKKVKPKWSKEPQDITSPLFEEINLECNAKSYPSASIKWTKLTENSKLLIVIKLNGKF